MSLAKFKHAIRRQHMIMRRHETAAIAALPELLARAEPSQIEEMSQAIERLLSVTGLPGPTEEQRWKEIKLVFDAAAPEEQSGWSTTRHSDTFRKVVAMKHPKPRIVIMDRMRDVGASGLPPSEKSSRPESPDLVLRAIGQAPLM